MLVAWEAKDLQPAAATPVVMGDESSPYQRGGAPSYRSHEQAFPYDYSRFHREIQKRMPDTQGPNLQPVGVRNADFETQTPFTT